MKGTSFESMKETAEALTGSFQDDGWTITWFPVGGPSILSLGVKIVGHDECGDTEYVTDVMKMPTKVLQLVGDLREAFEEWKSGHAYCFSLPLTLRPRPDAPNDRHLNAAEPSENF